MKLLHTVDRASAQLDGQLLSSTTSGSFTLSNLAILGTQDWDSPSGEQAILSINNEQILCTLAESGGTLTATIATSGRGYNGTTAATHAANDYAYVRMTSTHYEVLKDEVASHVLGLSVYDGVVPTVTDANTLTVVGEDQTAKFVVGRVVVYKIVSTWYRAIVRSSSYGAGNTTIEVTGDALPGSGTILSIGFEMNRSVNKAVDYELIKQCAAAPAENPPSGYVWFYLDSGSLKFKDSAGAVNVILTDVSSPPIASGSIMMFGGNTAPTGWLKCDGSAVSRATYASLFAALFPTVGTFTITIASPGVATLTSHGLATGDGVYLTTTGALPTGLTANTRYWVIKVDANTFRLATSLANALAGTAINTSGSQSGTHTARLAPAGVGDGTTTFNLPSLVGTVPVGKDQSQTEFAGLGQTGGAKTHTLTEAEMPAHTHNGLDGFSGSGGSGTYSGANRVSNAVATSSTGGGGAHNNLQPYFAINFIIKT